MQSQLGDVRQGKLLENVLGFGRALRRAGVSIDSSKIALAMQALSLINIDHKEEYKSALFTTMIHEKKDRDIFNELFEQYFKNPDLANKLLGQMLPRTEEKKIQNNNRAKDALQISRPENKSQPSPEQKIEFDARLTFSDIERLRYADFNSLSSDEYQLVEQLAQQIPLYFPQHHSRRYRSRHSGQMLDFRRILQSAARNHYDLTQIYWRAKKEQFLPLMILLDVSGSMERYTRLILSFLHAATRHHPHVDVFSFGTNLTDLSKSFQITDTDQMLAQMNRQIQDFAGGTKLGQSMTQLNTEYNQRMIGHRTVVILITDGLDTGTPEQLEQALERLQKKSRSILWLNPLMRYEDYQPIAQGPAILTKYVDKMVATHHLESLQQLSKHLRALIKT
jgi:uncharacterized protein